MADITLRIKYEYDLEDNGFLGIFTATKDYFLTEDRQSVADVVREICEVLKHKTFYITIDALTNLGDVRMSQISRTPQKVSIANCKIYLSYFGNMRSYYSDSRDCKNITELFGDKLAIDFCKDWLEAIIKKIENAFFN